MNKKVLNIAKKIGLIFTLSFVITSCALLYGASSRNNTAETMALAFKTYYKKTGHDYIAAEISSDDPRDPMRRSEFSNASAYENFWQLKKGPDNSLIRVLTPTYLKSASETVAPLTIYPMDDELSDEGALTPVVYSGYDADFRGDYLDIKIVKLSNQKKQIEWGDFYSGGKLELYKKDTHSIMVSQNTAKKIFASRNNVPINTVTDENIESLVGTILRSTVISESGTTRALERETSLPDEEQNKEIINSKFFNSKYCNLKQIVGILDNKSAQKYYPLIGDDFVFVFPTNYISYDYFHPRVYGMFKQNFVGNRTSLRYLMPLSEFADTNEDYHFCFCDVNDNELVRNGFLQQNFEHCKEFYKGNNAYRISIISFIVGLFAELSLLAYLIFKLLKAKRELKRLVPFSILGLSLILLAPILIWTVFSHFPFFSFQIPTYSIYGFLLTSIFNIFTLVTVCVLNIKKQKKTIQIKNSSKVYTKKEIRIFNGLFGVLFGFIFFVLVNVFSTKSSVVSIGIPSLVILFGLGVGICIFKFPTTNIKKPEFKNEILLNIWYLIGLIFGIGIAAGLTLLGYIWIPGVAVSLLRIVLSISLGVIVLVGSYFLVVLIAKIKKAYTNALIEKYGNDFYDEIEI